MTLASPWLLAAMSEHGAPSSSRVISVVGILILAPLLLLGALRWAPDAFGLAFDVWVAIVGGVYVGGRFAPTGYRPRLRTANTMTPTTVNAPPPEVRP